MSFREILCPIFSAGADEPVLAAAEMVAEMSDARLTALLVEVEPDPVYTIEGALERGVLADALALARKEFEEDTRKLQARAVRGPKHFELSNLAVTAGKIDAAVGAQAQLADLTIMLRPGEAPLEDIRTRMFEGVLFASGRPVLLVPPGWGRRPIGRNIVVGWNGKREAARALADAAPFLDRAEHVTVLYVAVGAGRAKAEASGAAVVAQLARRGKHAELRHAGEFGFGDGAILMAQAGGLEADLIVMGGYGSPRLREFVFGGATREVMNASRIPVLMSH